MSALVIYCGNIIAQFLLKLQASLGSSYACFEAMGSFDKASFVLGNQLWEDSGCLELWRRIEYY